MRTAGELGREQPQITRENIRRDGNDEFGPRSFHLSWREESVKRIQKVVKLPQECMKHVRLENDNLANQIFLALLKATSRRGEPVKLSDLTNVLYGAGEKDKQDVVRLTMEKTLIRCGAVDKIHFSDRDVRYFPVAYRFQEVNRVETGTGSKIEQLVGELLEMPREFWPLPDEYFHLVTSERGYEEALAKLDQDSKSGAVDPRTYGRLKEKIQSELAGIAKKLRDYEAIRELLT